MGHFCPSKDGGKGESLGSVLGFMMIFLQAHRVYWSVEDSSSGCIVDAIILIIIGKCLQNVCQKKQDRNKQWGPCHKPSMNVGWFIVSVQAYILQLHTCYLLLIRPVPATQKRSGKTVEIQIIVGSTCLWYTCSGRYIQTHCRMACTAVPDLALCEPAF